MSFAKGEVVFYGVDNISEKLDSILKTLNLKKQYFEMKLIMSEAVNNAFIHGNNSNKNKPIHVKWELKENLLRLEVTDCGCGIKNIECYKEINENNILNECGRGLYIINSYVDEMKFNGSSIIMKKCLL
jgi:serine/threonine-protein kinase RsbW